VTPDWDLGEDDPWIPIIKYGTNRLKLYKVSKSHHNAWLSFEPVP